MEACLVKKNDTFLHIMRKTYFLDVDATQVFQTFFGGGHEFNFERQGGAFPGGFSFQFN